MKKTKYTREYILELCDKAIVSEKNWRDRDTPEAQAKIGLIHVYLKAGCKFRIITKSRYKSDMCVTNSRTIWIEIFHYEFEESKSWHIHYLPTEERLKESNGEDWY